jgi:glutathione synthase/RimK-type ligase-like ATP-grasp enzyme
VAWNVARGGRFDNVGFGDWPLRVVRKAVEAFELSDLDFGGVDVMTNAQDEAFVIEINSAPSLTSPYRQQCMARCFDYIYRNGKDRIARREARGGWRKFVHPAISDEAEMVAA